MSITIKQTSYQISELLIKPFISDELFKKARANYRILRKEATTTDMTTEQIAEWESLETQFTALEQRFTKQIDESESLLDTIKLLLDAAEEQPDWRGLLLIVGNELNKNELIKSDERLSSLMSQFNTQTDNQNPTENLAEITAIIESANSNNRKLANVILQNLPENIKSTEEIAKVLASNEQIREKEQNKHRYEQKRGHFISRTQFVQELLEREPVDWFEVDKTYKRLNSQWQAFLEESENVDDEVKSIFLKANDSINTVLEPIRAEEKLRREDNIKELAALLDNESTLKKASQLAREFTKNWKPKASLSVEEEQALWGRFKPLCDEIYERNNKQREEFLEKLKLNHAQALKLLESIKSVIDDKELSEDDRKSQIAELREKWFANKPLPKNEVDNLFSQFKELTAAYYQPKHKDDKRKGRVAAKKESKTTKGPRTERAKGANARKNNAKELWTHVDAQLKARLEGKEAEKANIKVPSEPLVFQSASEALTELELIAGLTPSDDANAQKRKLERLQLSLSGKLPKPAKEAELIIAGFNHYTPASAADVDQWGVVIEKALTNIEKLR